jgi:hypothetical protein
MQSVFYKGEMGRIQQSALYALSLGQMRNALGTIVSA